MNISRPTSDLIISLGHGVLGLAIPVEGGWETTYPVPGLFRVSDMVAAMDRALEDHPDLFTIKDRVELLVLQGPHVVLPAYDRDPVCRHMLTRKYIRVRHGETILTESVEEGHAFGYALPGAMLGVVREYFANTQPVHLATVLWQAVSSRLMMQSGPASRTLWVVPVGDQLALLGAEEGRLVFSRVIHAPTDDDRSYFILACHHLLCPSSTHWTGLEGQPPGPVPQSLEGLGMEMLFLPSLGVLIDEYRQCGS